MSKESTVMETILAVIIGGLVGVLIVAAAFAYSAISVGVAVCYLWAWFMVPLGLMEIGFAHAAGIATLIGLMSMSRTANYIKGEYKDGKTGLIGELVAPWLALLFGYIIHSFM